VEHARNAPHNDLYDYHDGAPRDHLVYHDDYGSPGHHVLNDYDHHENADHNMACEAPTTKRQLTAHDGHGNFNDDQLLYNCRDHMMTSVGDISGYSVVWFSPEQTFTKINEVCVDVNLTTNLTGFRSWWEFAVVPVNAPDAFADQDIAGTANLPDYGDVGATVLSFKEAPQYLRVWVGDNLVGKGFPRIDKFRGDLATRVPHCFADLGNGNLRITTINDDGSPFVLTVPGKFPAGEVKAVFKHHTYTPWKACTEMPEGKCQSYTWHWDNVVVKGV
jgi:hypothetical protein